MGILRLLRLPGWLLGDSFDTFEDIERCLKLKFTQGTIFVTFLFTWGPLKPRTASENKQLPKGISSSNLQSSSITRCLKGTINSVLVDLFFDWLFCVVYSEADGGTNFFANWSTSSRSGFTFKMPCLPRRTKNHCKNESYTPKREGLI